MARTRPGTMLLALGALCALADLLRTSTFGFVSAPQLPRQPQVLGRRAGAAEVKTSASKDAAAVKEPAAGGEKKDQKEIDDAVLQMAMAMAEEEDGGVASPPPPKKEEGGFDIQPFITAFLVSLIIYSIGSSIISITTGRIQDRSGGDFTLYDFLDNIFSFKDWSLEYSLGFDPFKVFGGAAAPDPDAP
uniref:Uncharacterized protein n=1 Tax=Alexandrium andersonii TaxID=327968 RepID=A0A7S2IDB7_9DINO